MRLLPRLLCALLTLTLSLPTAFAHGAGEELTKAANAFLGSLDDAQRAKATFAFENEERTHWIFVPAVRKGLPLKEMNPGQRHFAQALLSVTLSQRGHMKAESIMASEHLLSIIEEGKGANKRDAENYFVSVFGKPDAKGTWGWRWEGHHLSQNFTVVDGELVGATPSFMGTNPGQIKADTLHVGDNNPGLVGFEILDQEDNLGRALAKSLTDEQRKSGFLAGDVPKDVITSNKPKADGIIKHKGIAVSALTSDQKKILGGIIREYVGRARSDFSLQEMAAISQVDENQIFFAWSGGLEVGQGHYYSIVGPEFIFELDNTQNGANHVHATWRDLKKDFGYDPLAKHLKEAHGK
ncbi:MAG: DUF3500 domain-containing protein [Verrucomicrobia bacterium]|nr:DUF3500 domain-containing protein [Verrucomicrobiota bacterium]